MRRREFIGLLGGMVVACPGFGGAQPAQRQRLIGVMTNLSEDDPERKRSSAMPSGSDCTNWAGVSARQDLAAEVARSRLSLI
jgi:hypothetical protein